MPAENTTLGLDEHTGIIIDFEKGECEVSGVSSVSLVRECDPEIYPSGKRFTLKDLGDFKIPVSLDQGISAQAWAMVTQAPLLETDAPPEEVVALVDQRASARERKDFAESDRLRDQIAVLGWQVQDTKDGQKVVKG